MSTRVPLPAGTTLGHSYEWGVDVDVADAGEPKDYQPVRRMNDFSDNPSPQTTDGQTYDDLGSANNPVTGWDPSLSFSTLANRLASSGLYLPEIEALMARTLPTALGDLAEINVRWYHKPATGTPNPNQAFEGRFTVSRTRANTGAEGTEKINWTLAGVGPATQIPNPFAGWDEEPETP